jgi:hypothetical protein
MLMADLQATLYSHRQAVDAFLAAARVMPPAQWKEPRARGKWSPAQIAEHLALAYEGSRGILHGAATGLAVPALLRPLIRTYLLQPVLWTGRFFPGSRSPKAFQPTGSPVTQDVMLARLQATTQAFEKYVSGAQGTHVDHPFFGRLSLVDFVRLQEIHIKHHYRQLPAAKV